MAEELANTATLLRRWHDGDRGALDALIARDFPWIRDRVHSRVGEGLARRAETDDYVNEIMIRVMEYGPRFVIANRLQFRSLIARIVENCIRNRAESYRAACRDTHRERELESDTSLYHDPPRDSVDLPDSLLVAEEQKHWVQLAVDLLPAESAKIVRMRHWEERSFTEIGEEFGINAEAARQRLLRVMPKLARNLTLLAAGKLDELLFGDD